MDSAKSWLSKLQQKDKVRTALRNEETSNTGSGGGNDEANAEDEALSKITRQKAAAAKQYIENHYKEQMKNLQERKERWSLGAIMFEMLVGYPPFYSEDPMSTSNIFLPHQKSLALLVLQAIRESFRGRNRPCLNN
ncbi:hypothetical protein V6N13_071583 [Hibiscus sabdariffa]